MTTFTTNTEFATRSHQTAKIRDAAVRHVRRLIGRLPTLFARAARDPEAQIARMERREAARRAVDTLLR